MSTSDASRREWFTPIWAVPVLLLILVALYTIANGGIPDSGGLAVPSAVTP
ncbi:MAG: hypothetical protein ACM30I_16835 [Gemmatimonas sp.]